MRHVTKAIIYAAVSASMAYCPLIYRHRQETTSQKFKTLSTICPSKLAPYLKTPGILKDQIMKLPAPTSKRQRQAKKPPLLDYQPGQKSEFQEVKPESAQELKNQEATFQKFQAAPDPAGLLNSQETSNHADYSEFKDAEADILGTEFLEVEGEAQAPETTIFGSERLEGERFKEFWGFKVWDMGAAGLTLLGRPNAEFLKTTEEQKPMALEAMEALDQIVDEYPRMLGWMRSGYTKDIANLQAMMMFFGCKAAMVKMALATPEPSETAQADETEPLGPVGGWPDE